MSGVDAIIGSIVKYGGVPALLMLILVAGLLFVTFRVTRAWSASEAERVLTLKALQEGLMIHAREEMAVMQRQGEVLRQLVEIGSRTVEYHTAIITQLEHLAETTNKVYTVSEVNRAMLFQTRSPQP